MVVAGGTVVGGEVAGVVVGATVGAQAATIVKTRPAVRKRVLMTV
jgi:hypothetical protein